MKFNIGICDDEKSTCSELEDLCLRYFKDCSDKVETFVWYTGESCCNDLKKGLHIDALFLDIELPGSNGIDVGRFIREDINNDLMQIVYISSKTNYAMALFKNHPYDFIVKPIESNVVENVLHKLIKIDKNDRGVYSYISNKVLNKLNFRDILYFMSRDKHIEIHTKDKIEIFRGKLKDEEKKLPEIFARVGQSYIINIRYVKECHFDRVLMSDETEINISNKYRIKFRDKIYKDNNPEV